MGNAPGELRARAGHLALRARTNRAEAASAAYPLPPARSLARSPAAAAAGPAPLALPPGEVCPCRRAVAGRASPGGSAAGSGGG